jgi:hypothetical protein
MPAGLLTTAEVGKALHISERGVRKLIEHGLLNAERYAVRSDKPHQAIWLIRKADLARYIKIKRPPGRPPTTTKEKGK